MRRRLPSAYPALFPILLGVILLLESACGTGNPAAHAPAIGEAYAGPIALHLRSDIPLKSPTVATVKHGDKLDIVRIHRRWVEVRTSDGKVGWTDSRQLLSPDDMKQLGDLSKQAEKLPSMGLATTFEALNMHGLPSRQSPGFMQLPEGAKVEVVEHKVTPRTETAPAPLLTPIPKPKFQRRRGHGKEAHALPAPPAAQPPKPPVDWLEMSGVDSPGAPKRPVTPAEPPKPVPMEDWYLVRTKDGKAGWVLARMVTMAIPDEVAQYAEGHRITSYFPLGTVTEDDGTQKHNWLWTTLRHTNEPYEFDSFRVFVWSRRHHRYETAYIERDVVGHYPVSVDTSGVDPSFTLILDDDNGKPMQNRYVFNGYRVNLTSSQPYNPPQQNRAATALADETAPVHRPWYETAVHSIKSRLQHLLHKQ